MTVRRIIDTSEVLGVFDLPDGARELCAIGVADYDEESSRLFVRLDSFLRGTNLREKESRCSAEWLPKAETVVEHLGAGETIEAAREIFKRWVKKLRQAAPALHDSA